MHFEKASSCCCIFACCCGVGCPPFGKSFWQTLWADWNVGDFGLMPRSEPNWITPWLFGSGKLLTPCLRMQDENFAPSAALPAFMAISKWAFAPPPGAPPSAFVPAPELCVVDVVVVVDEAMLAMPGAPEVPPQPAATRANAAPVTAGATRIE